MKIPRLEENREIDPELLEYTKKLIQQSEDDAKVQTSLRENAFNTLITE
jgi:hypothetical protein